MTGIAGLTSALLASVASAGACRRFRRIIKSEIWGFTTILTFGACASIATPAIADEAFRLTDSQLDKVNAGLMAAGSGASEAHGDQAFAATLINTIAGQPGPGNGSAIGQVTGTASSTNMTGAAAVASLSLAISFSSP